MTLTLYQNLSDDRNLNKKITEIISYSGTLREESSVTNPAITVQGQWDSRINYFFIPEFNRYYYLTDAVQKRNNIIELHGRVDVLMSFRDQIKQCSGIIKRSASKWNLYLDDGSLKVYQNKRFITKEFPSGFSAQEFILTLGG